MKTDDKASTSTLLCEMNQLSLQDFIEKNESIFETSKFDELLNSFAKEKGMIPERIIKAACIDRTYGHQLFSGTRKPSRDKILLLSFAMGLTLEQTQKLLRSAGRSQLSPRIKRDAVVIFSLNRHLPLDETQELLLSMDLAELWEN